MKKFGHTEEALYQYWFYQTMGSRIKDARKKQGDTQEELADALGISRVAMVCIENGLQRLPIHKLGDICRLLKTTIDEVVPSRDNYKPEDK